MTYTPCIGTLGYVLSSDGTELLMMHRNSRPEDIHLGKYNGLGGKLLPNEDVATGMVREIREEAGIEVVSMVLRGTLNWTGFGPLGENWLAFIFRIDQFRGTPHQQSPEGTVEWVPMSQLDTLPMWEGDRCFLPMVFDNDPRPFHGFMPYDNDHHIGWSYTRF